MSGVRTSLVRDAHAYTRSKSPWILTERKSRYGKLIHYLSGGGMGTFGRTVRQEEVSRRQSLWLVFCCTMLALWAALLVF